MATKWNPPRTENEWNKFMDLIIDEKYILGPPFHELMMRTLPGGLDYTDLVLTPDNTTRVELVSPTFPCIQFRNMLRSIDTVFRKDDEVRNMLEIRGDGFKESGDIEKALRCYALALGFAQNVSSIYMKRADIFISLEQYDLALIEVERSLRDEDSQSTDMKTLLLEQKQLCETLIIPKIQSEEDLKRKVYRDQIFANVQSGNSPSKALPDFISVEYRPIKGRYLVTKVDLEPGSVVLVEDPYVCAPVNGLKFQTKFCSRCLKTVSNPIPCETCVMTYYCGEECRDEDQNYEHKYECPVLPYLHCMKIPQSFYLCFKAICKTGPEILKQLWIDSKSFDNTEEAWWVPPNATHRNHDPYSQVLNMEYHVRSGDMPIAVWLSISMAYALRIKTTFFDTITESEKLDFEKFIAIVILHHSQCFPYNTMALGTGDFEVKDLNKYLLTAKGGPETETATGIFSLSNLMNHSCTPTTFRQCMAGGRIALITNRALKSGEKLTHCYGFNHLNLPLHQRGKALFEHFRISCDCAACAEDWPLFRDIFDSSTTPFVCRWCKKRIPDLLAKLPIKEIDADLLKCGDSSSTNRSNINNCDPFSHILEMAQDLVLKNKPLEALPLITESIKHFQTDPYKQSVQLTVAQDRLMNCYDLISNSITVSNAMEKISTNNRGKFCSIL